MMTILPASGTPTPRPFFLHGWDFLGFLEAGDESAVAVRGVAAWEGPMVVFNDHHIQPEELEDPAFAKWWLPNAMFHIAHAVLSESSASIDSIGPFTSSPWGAYRGVVSRHMDMTWDNVLIAMNREGADYMAECVAHSLFLESGLCGRLTGAIPVLVE